MKQGYYIGIGAIIIILLILGGIFLWQKGGETDGITPTLLPPTGNEAPPTVTPPTPPSDGDNQIPERWKTYRNEEYGFVMKYPEGWQVNFIDARKEGYDADAIVYIFNIEVNDKRMQKELDGIQYNNGLQIVIHKFNDDIQKFISERYMQSESLNYISQMKIMLPNGMEAIRVKYHEPSAYDAIWEIPLLHTKSFVFEFWQWPSDPSLADANTKEVLDQILSTFYFLD